MKLIFNGWQRRVFTHNHEVTPRQWDKGRLRTLSSDAPLVWSNATTAHGVVHNLGLSGDFRVEFQFRKEELRNWFKVYAQSDPAAAIRLAAEIQADAMIELASSARAPGSEIAK